jgi:hypothetical protein
MFARRCLSRGPSSCTAARLECHGWIVLLSISEIGASGLDRSGLAWPGRVCADGETVG